MKPGAKMNLEVQRTVDGNHIAKFPGCQGTLSLEQNGERHQAAITFDVEVDQAGEIWLAIEEQSLTEENFWIQRVSLAPTPVVAALILEGRTAEGTILNSDSVHLTDARTTSTPSSTTLQLSAKAQRLTAVATNEVDVSSQEYKAEYWVAGLRWFGSKQFSAAEGEIAIAGNTNPEDYSKVTGRVAIRSPLHGRSLDAWLSEIDAAVNRILDVVSFADGHFMRPAVRQVFSGDKFVKADFLGTNQGTPPYKPPLHWLNFSESLPPLIRAYTQDLVDRTGLNVAIEWHLMPHIYNEARFLAQMTAIEHLVDVFSKHSPDSTYIDRKIFNSTVAPAIVSALRQLLDGPSLGSEVSSDAKEGMVKSLKGINRRSLRSNLERMMRDYKVSLDGLEDLIKPLIDVRNDIIHRGLSCPENGTPILGQRVAEAEELVRRIILALLGFQGRYTSWLDRIEDREFKIPTP